MAPSPAPRLRELTLTLSSQCNLRCSYCYVPHASGPRMDDRVMRAALELLAASSDPDDERSLSFFGGEPFLHVDTMERAVRSLPRGRGRLRVVTPTNGLLLDDRALALCRDAGVELAISIDGISRTTGRPYADGRDSTGDLLARLPDILALASTNRVLARMTVTPSNVAELAHNVRAIHRLGFRKIVFLPDFEQPWSEEAIEQWATQHRLIGTWLIGARGAGAQVPDLPVWRGIESRLLLHKPKRACGAGERLAAITPDGRLVPCYRFSFERDDRYVLGDVFNGFTRADNLARFASLDPADLRPERGDCATCSARDGCTHICPAQGMLALGDPLGVPEVVCRLMRAQVEAIRRYAATQRVGRRRVPRPAWAAAVMATAMATAVSAASCGGQVEGPGPVVQQDGSADGSNADVQGPGVCPVQVDASADSTGPDVIGPGVCPVQADASEETIGPGICDYAPDAGDAAIGPGLCPAPIDAAGDWYGGGVCASIGDASGGNSGPGLC